MITNKVLTTDLNARVYLVGLLIIKETEYVAGNIDESVVANMLGSEYVPITNSMDRHANQFKLGLKLAIEKADAIIEELARDNLSEL